MNRQLTRFCAYLLLTFLAAFAQYCSAQEILSIYKSDSSYLKGDTNKVLLYQKIATKYRVRHDVTGNHAFFDSVLVYYKKAKELSYKISYHRGVELSLYNEGCLAEDQKNFSLAIRYYREAANVAEAYKLYPDVYVIYDNCLNIYYYQADYPNALEIAQKGLSLAEQLNEKETEAHYNNQLGFIYQKQEKADQSIKYYLQYLNLANEIHLRMMVADACNGIADDYLLKKEYKTSLGYSFRALNIYKKMKALPNGYDDEKFDGNRKAYKHDRIAYTLFKISTAYKSAGDYKEALYYSTRIFDIFNDRKKRGLGLFNKFDLASYYINMGDIYRLLGNYKQARFFLDTGLAISRSILHREDIRDAYGALAKNFAAQKRYDSAYYYHVLYTGLKDSIINEKVSREINQLEVQRRDREITLLNQQQKLKETETERQTLRRNFFIGFTALIAVISFLLFFIQSNVKQQKLRLEKQVAVHAERQRISSDMHDDIGTGLSTMLIYINMLKLKLADGADGPNITRIADLGTGLVDQMKEIVWALSPGNDRLDSLLLFIRQYFVLLFEPLNYKLTIVFPTTIPDIELEGELRRNVFLCVKEALNNVVKHANADSIDLRVEIVNDTLIIRMHDNGRGLSAPLRGYTTGNGLKNIARRMNLVKGKADIFTDHGTVVRLELDLPGYTKG